MEQMNREIKFRVYDYDLKKMRCLNSTHDIVVFDEKGNGDYHNMQTGFGEWFSDLMQYTGLKDKNGVEVYEGDLILIGEKRRKVEVIFKDGSFGYLYNGVCVPFQNQSPEVIGNIYENEVDKDENRRL